LAKTERKEPRLQLKITIHKLLLHSSPAIAGWDLAGGAVGGQEFGMVERFEGSKVVPDG